MKIEIQNEKYLIEASDPALLGFIGQLQGIKYNVSLCRWVAARNYPNALDLHARGYFSDIEMLKKQRPSGAAPDTAFDVKATLFKHQIEWETWGKMHPKAMLIAEMGLGKTLMALQWLRYYGASDDSILIVCPNSLIYYWVQEIERFTGKQAIPVVGASAQRLNAFKRLGIHVVNYDFLAAMGVRKGDSREDTKNEFWRVLKRKKSLVFDESHKLKNPSSLRSKVLHKFTKTADHVLLLTGTPVSQGAHDYYSQFKLIDSTLLGVSFTAFKTRYCIQQQVRGAPFGVKKIVGYRNLDELNRVIAPYTFNLRKVDCLDLPPKMYTIRSVALRGEQAKAYRDLKEDMVTWVSETEALTAANVLTRIVKLQEVTQGFLLNEAGQSLIFKENPKLEALVDVLEDLGEDESLVVVCKFVQDVQTVMKKLQELSISAHSIHGGVSVEDRHRFAESFQKGEYRVIVGEIRTIGVGYNLQRANKMVFYSNSYSLVDRLQAEDRIHRAGSVGEKCLYIDLVAMETIDEEIIRVLRNKLDVAEMLTHLRMKEKC